MVTELFASFTAPRRPAGHVKLLIPNRHFVVAVLATFLALTSHAAEPSWMSGFVMPQVREPSIPARSAKVTDFGAVGDGRTLCSAAIAKGIESLAAQGGGRLVFPAGVWLTGEIIL